MTESGETGIDMFKQLFKTMQDQGLCFVCDFLF